MPTRTCSRCRAELPLEQFKLKSNGTRTSACGGCCDKQALALKERRLKQRALRDASNAQQDPGKENRDPAHRTDEHAPATGDVNTGCSTPASASTTSPPVITMDPCHALPWDAFCALLQQHRLKACDLKAIVSLAEVRLDELEPAEAADGKEDTDETDNDAASSGSRVPELAAAVLDAVRIHSGYRFNLHNHVVLAENEYFACYCAQREGHQSKSQRGKPRAKSTQEAPKKLRATLPMKRFACGGRLHLSIPHDGQRVHVHLYHELAHDAYCSVDVPEDIERFVYENRHMMPSAIWAEVLKKHSDTELEQWQIARLWATLSQDKWRQADDQVDSARKLLEESDDAIVIPLDDEPGVTSIAFLLKECVESLNTGVVEIAMDSTWKTNALGYETYGLIAEANGQSVPLGFILTTSTADAQPGAKDRLLQQCLRMLITKCPNARLTLSDKDTSEINACRTALPSAKHQLCYWHAVRYLEQRLGESKAPALYDARLAHQKFDFIDPTWVPGVHNGHVVEGFTADDTDKPGAFEPELDDLQTDDLTTCLPPLFMLVNGEERVPVWPAPKKATAAQLPQFCPPENRPHIIEMFRKHLHLHPAIPVDADGTRMTADKIHKSAVYQMYRYCYERDLSQVWAYLWNRWYAPSQWLLWARAACPAIPVLKTTMVVECVWRYIKHRDLRAFHRPRIDLLVYTILQATLPYIKHRLYTILGQRRVARESKLASWQKAMKAEWIELSKPDHLRNMQKELAVLRKKGKGVKFAQARVDRLAELEADCIRPHGDYHTDLQRWTCSCPSYVISRFLLCKHIVRKAIPLLGDTPTRDLRFWLDLRRRRLPPFYIIPGIHTTPLPGLDADLEAIYHPARTPVSQAAPAVRTAASTPVPALPIIPDPAPLTSMVSGPPAASHPAPIDEVSQDRVYPTSAEVLALEDDFKCVLEILRQPQGIHPKLLERISPFLGQMQAFAHDVRQAKQRRTPQRTYDASPNTMFLD